LIQSPQGICAPPWSGTWLVGARPAAVRTALGVRGKNRPAADTNMVMRAVLEPDRAERAAVAAWRRRQLAEAGFCPGLAAALADEGADVHALIELVERGCRPRLAARILAPLERGAP
jgi:hypothetical protein